MYYFLGFSDELAGIGRYPSLSRISRSLLVIRVTNISRKGNYSIKYSVLCCPDRRSYKRILFYKQNSDQLFDIRFQKVIGGS